MHLQELGEGRVTIVEVAPASPAFDAGIKAGDELTSFAGFQGETYRKWIDGIRRLATDAEDSSRLPITLLRRGEQVDAQVRIPESSVGPIKLPLGPMPPASEGVAIGIESAALPGASGNLAINNAGPFGNFFGGVASPAAEKAMAEIFRIGGEVATRNDAAQPPTAPQPAPSARIGIAGFRDSANGMLVMVDVGALAPGNYLVAIDEPGHVEGIPSRGSVPNNPTPPGTFAPPTVPPVPQDTGPATNPAPNVFRKPPAGGAPQSSVVEIPPTVLAQVTNETQPPTGSPGPTIPPTGQVSPSTVPPTGQVNPSNTTPTGQSTVNNALLEQARRAREANAAASGADQVGRKAPNQIGTLTVDQNGAGRMQTVVEALRVQDVVGQAIVVYTQPSTASNALPPNLDPTADPIGDERVTDPAGPLGRSVPTTPPATPSTTRTVPDPGAVQNTAKTQPAAVGIIRFLSDRRPATAAMPDPADAFRNPPQPVR
jgi:hypothetical protein